MMHCTILFSKLKIKDTKRCHFKKHGIGLFNPHACMTFSCFFFLFLQLFLAQLWVSLQEFTVLPTEKFRRCMIRSSSVIFLPMSSPTEYVRRLYLRRWFPIPSVYRSEKQKNHLPMVLQTERARQKKKIPAWNIPTDFYSVGDIVITDGKYPSVNRSVNVWNTDRICPSINSSVLVEVTVKCRRINSVGKSVGERLKYRPN